MAFDYTGDLPADIVTDGDRWFIQGKRIGSEWELNYAVALSNAGWEYEYLAAWWLNGGPLEIDFRVFSYPKVTFIFIDGQYFHSGTERQQDYWERQQLFVATRNFANPPVTVNNFDCETYDAAYAHVIRTLGRR